MSALSDAFRGFDLGAWIRPTFFFLFHIFETPNFLDSNDTVIFISDEIYFFVFFVFENGKAM